MRHDHLDQLVASTEKVGIYDRETDADEWLANFGNIPVLGEEKTKQLTAQPTQKNRSHRDEKACHRKQPLEGIRLPENRHLHQVKQIRASRIAVILNEAEDLQND